jgi:hypothetical protein
MSPFAPGRGAGRPGVSGAPVRADADERVRGRGPEPGHTSRDPRQQSIARIGITGNEWSRKAFYYAY